MSEYVLDASAVLAYLKREPGGDTVAPLLVRSLMTAVNLSEMAAKLDEEGLQAEQLLRAFISAAGVTVVAFDDALAYRAGALRLSTKPYGLSLGDRACLALAQQESLPAVTAERSWMRLSLGVAIQVVRP